MLPLLDDSNASFLILPRCCFCFFPSPSSTPCFSEMPIKTKLNFQHFCFSATPALPYAPYTKRMMHIWSFCYDRHIFVITSCIASSYFRHCNIMAPSLCPHKSSIPQYFDSRSLHDTAILAVGPLQALHRTIFRPKKLTRSQELHLAEFCRF